MRMIPFIRAGVLGALLSFPGTAEALPQSVYRIPHGTVFGCETCHPNNQVKELNDIGKLLQGIRHAYVSPDAWWTIMYNVDSDGDGLTNGEELGDPCGEWKVGDEQPTVPVVSNPGDAESWVELAEEPGCPPIPVADDATASTGAGLASAAPSVPRGACSFVPHGGAAGGSLIGAALGLSLALRICRRRSARLVP